MGDVTPERKDDPVDRWRRGGPMGGEHIEALAAEVEQLREALAFYVEGYTLGSEEHRSDCMIQGTHLRHGRRAREALDG